jgi:hypothetical protein
MTLPWMRSKLKVQKKYLAFFTVVPLLAATAFIQVPCPVCSGSGVISSTGMSDVVVTSLESVEQATFLVGCDTYRVYPYDITLTVQNEGDQDANGYVALILINTKTGKVLDTQYTVVDVAAGTLLQTKFAMSFMVSILEQPDITEISAKVLNNNVPCDACVGSGKVALNSWPLLESMKQTLVQSQRITPSPPPLYVETEAQPGDY